MDRPDLTAALDERVDASPQVGFQDRVDVDRELLASGAWTTGVTIGGAGHGSEPTSESSQFLWLEPAFTSVRVSLPIIVEGTRETGEEEIGSTLEASRGQSVNMTTIELALIDVY